MKKLLLFLHCIALLLSSCEEWELDQKDFIQVRLLQATATGLTSARAEAEALDLSIGPISDHGFIWSTIDEVPTIGFSQGQIDLGVKTSGDVPVFTADLSNLKLNTRYFIRAYAIVKEATVYSEVANFHTGTGGVITEAITYETGSSLLVSGRITGVEAGIVGVNHGFCWSNDNPNPTLDDSFINLGNQRTGSTFTYTLDSLRNEVPIYIRAYAILKINGELETVYGEVLLFDGDLRDVWSLVSEVPIDFEEYPNEFKFSVFSIRDKAYVYAYYPVPIFWEFTPQTNEWAEKTPFERDDLDFIRSFSIGDKGYCQFRPGRTLAGPTYGFEADIWQYVPTMDTWTAQSPFPAYPKEDHLIIGLEDKAYLGTGSDEQIFCSENSEWWAFDPAQNCDDFPEVVPGCWELQDNSPASHRFDAVGIGIGRNIYLGIGIRCLGAAPGDLDLRDWWAYDADLDSWEKRADFRGEPGTALTAFAIDDHAYVYSNDGTFWEYDPGTDAWQERKSLRLLPAPSIESEGFTVNGRGYILAYSTNFDHGGALAQIWRYDPK